MKSGIYQIRNVENGKRYIGSAKSIANRFYMHRCELKGGYHGNPHLQAAYNKYGKESFAYEIVERCDVLKLLIREQHHLDSHDPEQLYNILLVAGSPKGRKMSPEFCAARRAFRHTDEAKKAIGAGWAGKKRGPPSRQHRARNSMSNLGRKVWNKKVWPVVKCKVCGCSFSVKPHKIKDGKGKYCSVACKVESQRKTPTP